MKYTPFYLNKDGRLYYDVFLKNKIICYYFSDSIKLII